MHFYHSSLQHSFILLLLLHISSSRTQHTNTHEKSVELINFWKKKQSKRHKLSNIFMKRRVWYLHMIFRFLFALFLWKLHVLTCWWCRWRWWRWSWWEMAKKNLLRNIIKFILNLVFKVSTKYSEDSRRCERIYYIMEDSFYIFNWT